MEHPAMNTPNHTFELDCEAALALLPGYFDGELSELQAAPLRTHLLACRVCRTGAVDHKNLSRWFVAEEVVVPDGFAARVARRAFLGDSGEATRQHAPASAPEGLILPFVLQLTAAAAVVLFALSLLLGGFSLPAENELSATDALPPWERARLEAEAPVRLDLPATDEVEATEVEAARRDDAGR